MGSQGRAAALVRSAASRLPHSLVCVAATKEPLATKPSTHMPRSHAAPAGGGLGGRFRQVPAGQAACRCVAAMAVERGAAAGPAQPAGPQVSSQLQLVSGCRSWTACSEHPMSRSAVLFALPLGCSAILLRPPRAACTRWRPASSCLTTACTSSSAQQPHPAQRRRPAGAWRR